LERINKPKFKKGDMLSVQWNGYANRTYIAITDVKIDPHNIWNEGKNGFYYEFTQLDTGRQHDCRGMTIVEKMLDAKKVSLIERLLYGPKD
jgi:hypothetical protein